MTFHHQAELSVRFLAFIEVSSGRYATYCTLFIGNVPRSNHSSVARSTSVLLMNCCNTEVLCFTVLLNATENWATFAFYSLITSSQLVFHRPGKRRVGTFFMSLLLGHVWHSTSATSISVALRNLFITPSPVRFSAKKPLHIGGVCSNRTANCHQGRHIAIHQLKLFRLIKYDGNYFTLFGLKTKYLSEYTFIV